MAILDAVLEMCDASSLTSVAADSAYDAIGDYIDLGSHRNFYDTALAANAAEGGNIWWNLTVQTAFTSAGSPTAVTADLSTKSTTSAFAASATSLVNVASISKAAAAGTVLFSGVIPKGTDMQRYLGTRFKLGTAVLTAGKIDSWIGLDGETKNSNKIL